MRRIINSTYVSLDGLIELLDQLATSDALLMGPRTYEGFAEVWPSRDSDFAMYGFGPVAQTLLRHGLLDEVRPWVHLSYQPTP